MDFVTTIYPSGSEIYRGTVGEQRIQNQMWFTPDLDSAKIYGRVTAYRTIEPLVLLRMDNAHNLELLYQNAPVSIQEALSETFLLTKNKEIIRNSEAEQDKAILNYICTELGLDGFMSNPIQKNAEGTAFFHAELGICNSADKVQKGQVVYHGLSERGHATNLKMARDRKRQQYLQRMQRSRQRADPYDSDY